MAVAKGRKPGETIEVDPVKELFIYRLTGILTVVLCLLGIWTQELDMAWRLILTAASVAVLAAVFHMTGPRAVGRFWSWVGLACSLVAMAGIYLAPMHVAQKLIGWAILGYACTRMAGALTRKET